MQNDAVSEILDLQRDLDANDFARCKVNIFVTRTLLSACPSWSERVRETRVVPRSVPGVSALHPFGHNWTKMTTFLTRPVLVSI